jgi:hypothetical protein
MYSIDTVLAVWRYIRYKMLLAPATGQKTTILFKMVFLDVLLWSWDTEGDVVLASEPPLCSNAFTHACDVIVAHLVTKL